MQALGLGRELLVQTLGVVFVVLTVALGAGLAQAALLTDELIWLSAAALLPASLGMVLGQRVRRRLPEVLFRRVFFAALLLLGLYTIARALG